MTKIKDLIPCFFVFACTLLAVVPASSQKRMAIYSEGCIKEHHLLSKIDSIRFVNSPQAGFWLYKTDSLLFYPHSQTDSLVFFEWSASECLRRFEVPTINIQVQDNAPVLSKDKEDYLPCVVEIDGKEMYADYIGTARIRGRGNSTWLWYDKKPYRIKLDEKAKILGLGSNKDWVLLANYRDPTNLIVIGDIGDGRTYYKTKAGGTIKIWDADLGEGKMRIAGGYQVEQDTFVTVKTIYDQSVSGNGKSYILEEAPLLSSKKSLYATLKEKPEFKVFYDLMEGSDFFVTQMNKHACVDRNCNLFNAFNYTVYVPTNESLQALLDNGTLPTWEEYELETDAEIKKAIKDSIESFLKYHIQDNSVFLDKAAVSGNFETSAMNQETGRFYKLSVEGDGIQGLVLTDLRGNQRRVVQSNAGLYNLMVREYLFDNADKERATSIFASSYASVHQIDGPLFFK